MQSARVAKLKVDVEACYARLMEDPGNDVLEEEYAKLGRHGVFWSRALRRRLVSCPRELRITWFCMILAKLRDEFIRYYKLTLGSSMAVGGFDRILLKGDLFFRQCGSGFDHAVGDNEIKRSLVEHWGC
ncbi:hypothetical protein Dimus_027574 [Dionaea muscipula]